MTSPNAEQIAYWNALSGEKWVRLHDRLDQQLAPLGAAARAALGLRAGERVLEVGCGCGSESLRLAEAVGQRGRVLGVDVSRPMLEAARASAASAGFAHVEHLEADAQTEPFEPAAFDAVFSRFGVMFFDDPAAAFANVRRALAPDARLAFVCWAALAENPWMLEPALALRGHVALPPPPPPGAPGPFGFADAERVLGLLGATGFETPRAEALHAELVIGGGGSLPEAASFLMEFGPVAAALREAGRAAPDVLPLIVEALRKHETPRGVVMPCKAWLVTARVPTSGQPDASA